MSPIDVRTDEHELATLNLLIHFAWWPGLHQASFRAMHGKAQATGWCSTAWCAAGPLGQKPCQHDDPSVSVRTSVSVRRSVSHQYVDRFVIITTIRTRSRRNIVLHWYRSRLHRTALQPLPYQPVARLLRHRLNRFRFSYHVL